MELSELDGFLAGLAVGPGTIPWEEALALVWGGEFPEFANSDESATIHGTIVGRHSEIAAALSSGPNEYDPVFWEDASGNMIVEDWALGFVQAVALRSDDWKAVLRDDDSVVFLIPIAVLAGQADPAVQLDDVELPEEFVDDLVGQAGELIPGCVYGLYRFWHGAQSPTAGNA